MSNRTPKKETVYAYVLPKNKKFVERLAKKNNLPMSKCVDLILDHVRTKKELKLEVGGRTNK